jgi:acetyl esterase/lipase
MAIYRDYDQAALDDQYNNRKRVPDFQTTLDRWAADSAAVRAAGTGRLDIKYGPSERECLDIFPAHEGGPVLVFIHGGYWRSLDKDAHSFLASAINAAGIDLVMVGYPLAPQVTMDEIVAAVGRSFADFCQRPFRRRPPDGVDDVRELAGVGPVVAGRPDQGRLRDQRALRPGADQIELPQ